ncbi:hypothetical protein N8T08_000611 [Aspergillus melleus]|uniref:Uncharacterized protein n=1 Tax=Aspergillus melleus TaxID=138277 RepID=A0ACC3APX1_9EURO|nr:hypothetical protein N8T08_000611 [Aspergillus melleus]
MQLSPEPTFSQPSIPVETCSFSKSWEVPTPELICDHTRGPVHFEAAVQRVVNELGACTWLEAGSASSITSMAFAAMSPETRADYKFLAIQLKPSQSTRSLADVTRQLWDDGQNVQFWQFHDAQSRNYTRLNPPPYPFMKRRHWLEWKDSRSTPPELHRANEGTNSTGAELATSPTKEVWKFSFNIDNEDGHGQSRHDPHIRSATGLICFTDGEGNPIIYLQRAWDLITLDSIWDAIEQQRKHCTGNCSIDGDVIYQLLRRVADYGKVYRVINSLQSGPNYAKTYVKLPQDWQQYSRIIIPPVSEGVLQVAAVHVNLFGPHTRAAEMFLCTSIKCIQPSQHFSWEPFSAGWHVVARTIDESDKCVEYDIMAFAADTGRLTLLVHGVEFSYASAQSVDGMPKVAISSLDSIPNIPFQESWNGNGTESDPDYDSMNESANGSGNGHAYKEEQIPFTALHDVLRGFINIPTEGLSASTSLESLGVDSLAMSGIQQHGVPCDLALLDAMHLFDINAGRSESLDRSVARAYESFASYLHDAQS